MILFCLYLRVTQLCVQVCYKQAKKWQEAGDACANPPSLTSTPLFTTPNPFVYRWIRYKKCAEMMLEMKNDFDASNHFMEAAVHDP